MPPIRKTKLSTALVAALVCMPVLPVALAPVARSAPERPPVLQLATLPRAVRVRKQRRSAAVRALRARVLGRLREGRRWSGARGPWLPPRLPPRESYARGPPR